MKKSLWTLAATLTIPFVAGCATRPVTPNELHRASSDEICIAATIMAFTGSASYNGHPIPKDTLIREGDNRGLTCEPRDYYISVAKYRLQRQQATEQNTLLAEQAIVSGMQQGVQQAQSQFQARQALNAQAEAAYYQQQQAILAAQAQARQQAQQQQAANLQQGQAQNYQQQQLLNAIKAPLTTSCFDLGTAVSCNTTH